MARYDYNQAAEREKEREQHKGNYGDRPNVEYLSNFLKNEGDVVYVRFPYTSRTELGTVSVHKVQIGKANRFVDCLRAKDSDPLDMCPLCASKVQVTDRLFVKVLVYVTNNNGQKEIVPCIWDRPSSYLNLIADRIEMYKNCMFSITRRGVSPKVTYDILPLPTDIYNLNEYPADFSGFDNYDMSKCHAYLTKSADDMREFLATGAFPKPIRENQQQGTQQGYQQQSQYNQQSQGYQQGYQQQTNYQQTNYQQQSQGVVVPNQDVNSTSTTAYDYSRDNQQQQNNTYQYKRKTY